MRSDAQTLSGYTNMRVFDQKSINNVFFFAKTATYSLQDFQQQTTQQAISL